MVISIFIWFYFSFKLILTDKLNETNFLFQLQNDENGKSLEECLVLAFSLLTKGNITTDEIKEVVICTLEQLRDNSASSGNLIDLIFQLINLQLETILKQNNMTFLLNFTNEIFGDKSKFISDFKNVIQNRKEFVNYTIILVNKVFDGQNITSKELLKYIYNITNIDGMDTAFENIINSTHNGALLLLVERLLNGTEYAAFYNSIKDDILYPYKNQIFRIVYYIFKSGILLLNEDSTYDETQMTVLKMIRYFIISIKPIIRMNLKDILNQTNATFLYNLTAEIFNETNPFIDKLFDFIEKNPSFINITMNLIEISQNPNRTNYQIFSNIKKMFNLKGFRELVIDILKRHFFSIIQLLPRTVRGKNSVVPLLLELEYFIKRYQGYIVDLVYNILSHYLEYENMLKDIKEIIKETNNTNMLNDLRDIFTNKTLVEKISPLIEFHNNITNTIVKKAIADKNLPYISSNFYFL